MDRIKVKTVKWNPCCEAWYKSVNAIEVRATKFDSLDGRMRAEALTKLMQYTLGQFCPTCGNKIQMYSIREVSNG